MFFYKASQHFNKVLLFSFFLLPSLAFCTDDIANIIDKEKSDYQAWLSREDDLPSVIMWPLGQDIILYDTDMDEDPSLSVCTHLATDLLYDKNVKRNTRNQIPINFSSPKRRELWADACLIRPEDSLVAIGSAEQKKITISQILLDEVRRPNEDVTSLIAIGTYDEHLPFVPFFFSSDPNLVEGENGYLELESSTITAAASPWKEALQKDIKFFDEFDGQVYISSAANFQALVSMKKHEITHDDVGLQNEMVWMIQGSTATLLIEEKIEENIPSGHVRAKGWFDFNRDGFLDVIVEGDHQGCVYQELFVGTETGLAFDGIPIRPCYVH